MVTDRPISHVVLEIDQSESVQHKNPLKLADTIFTSSGSAFPGCAVGQIAVMVILILFVVPTDAWAFLRVHRGGGERLDLRYFVQISDGRQEYTFGRDGDRSYH